jgi:AtzE family amidohydrolase
VTAAAIAADVRAKRRTAREIIVDALSRIRARNAELNAFTQVFERRALERAERIDALLAQDRDPGPLAGVPFAAKNLFDIAGIVTRAGAKVTEGDSPAAHDAEAIAAWERSGAVLVGATNMDEFAYGFVTENAHDGPTHNPHDGGRIAGGSSGGSAAAVGAELVPLALASDTNGSIRVPAALCGIFGIRPTYGRLSRRGAYPFVESLDTVGPLARTAMDLRLSYAALDPRFEARSATLAPRCARLGGYFDTGLLPEARRAVDTVCTALGAITAVDLAHAREAREAAFLITAAEGGALHLERLRSRAEEYDPATRDRLIAGALTPAAWYLRAKRFGAFFRAEIARAFALHDVLIAPVTPYAATLIGQKTIEVDGLPTEIRPNLGIFTQPITLSGCPVVSVPVVVRGALPLGVQLIGRAGSESLLLAVAEQLEAQGAVGAGAVPVVA